MVKGSITGPRVSLAIFKPRQRFLGKAKKGFLPPSMQVGSTFLRAPQVACRGAEEKTPGESE